MFLINAAVLSLIVYEGKALVGKSLRKELIVYISLSVLTIFLELMSMGSPKDKSLFSALIDVLGIK